MKQRFFFFVGGVTLLLIIGLAFYAATQPKPSGYSTSSGKIFTVTVDAGSVGLEYITVTNLNTVNKPWTIRPVNLPYSFNCTDGDTLTFNATAMAGYKFNMWLPNTGIPYPQNPYTAKVSSHLRIIVTFDPIVVE